MKKGLITAAFFLGVVGLAIFGGAAELGYLPAVWTEWAPLAFVGCGVLLLGLAWRNWGSLMGWVFGKDDDNMK
ncbi:MAG: hypothetical protein IJD99_03490 [Clostridia bacterium]|nr:hypothetical protein [Clostridia bacterium]